MKKIGIVTTGGDCPGLNACIRAVVRTATLEGIEVMGIRRGYKGLMAGDAIVLDHASVSGIVNRGGTILLSARSEEFGTKEGVKKGARAIEGLGLEGLVILGGNGSLKGAFELSCQTRVPIIGIPKSIDNDIGGTEYAIGFDTAVNTVIGVIDKIRDTATSHERVFLIEVMGRKSGSLALHAAVAGGAEDVLIPETQTDVGDLCRRLEKGRMLGKISSIILVAEGDEAGGAFEIAQKIRACSSYDVRVSVVGHQQRGGAPSAFDRILAARLGSQAVWALLKGQRSKMVGYIRGEIVLNDLDFASGKPPGVPQELIQLSRVLAR
jgi:6-phosphofructokinase 1